MFGVGWLNRVLPCFHSSEFIGLGHSASDIVLLTDNFASHFVDTILCSDRMDNGSANGLKLPSIRDSKPLNNCTGCRIFVAGTKAI